MAAIPQGSAQTQAFLYISYIRLRIQALNATKFLFCCVRWGRIKWGLCSPIQRNKIGLVVSFGYRHFTSRNCLFHYTPARTTCQPPTIPLRGLFSHGGGNTSPATAGLPALISAYPLHCCDSGPAVLRPYFITIRSVHRNSLNHRLYSIQQFKDRLIPVHLHTF